MIRILDDAGEVVIFLGHRCEWKIDDVHNSEYGQRFVELLTRENHPNGPFKVQVLD